jgi:SNF2 family DNA or RNA helicase
LIITTYGLVRSSYSDFTKGGHQVYFDYIILDEGHQIKNSNAAVSKRCRDICGPSTRRLLVTGTPLMNNLMEVFCLFDFATGAWI